jgi:hypothetical protein
MRSRTFAAVIATAALLAAAPALAGNSTAATAAVVRPDGSAVTEDFTTAGGSSAWFAAPLTAGHSYVAEVEAPFNGAGSLSGGASPTLSLGIFRTDGTTAIASQGDISSCAPATGASGKRVTFSPVIGELGGPIKISVINGVAPNYAFRFRLYETGLSCPRWSINGYNSFVDIQNTSDCPLNVTLILYRSDGSIASTNPLAVLNANGATQISITAGMAGGVLVGSAAVFHNGAKGAVTGGIYQVQPGTASGANYLWAFSEIRSSGSTSGQ